MVVISNAINLVHPQLQNIEFAIIGAVILVGVIVVVAGSVPVAVGFVVPRLNAPRIQLGFRRPHRAGGAGLCLCDHSIRRRAHGLAAEL